MANTTRQLMKVATGSGTYGSGRQAKDIRAAAVADRKLKSLGYGFRKARSGGGDAFGAFGEYQKPTSAGKKRTAVARSKQAAALNRGRSSGKGVKHRPAGSPRGGQFY